MRQLIGSSSGIIIARVPTPPCGPNQLLVKVTHSMISSGTEFAAFRQVSADGETNIPYPLAAKAMRSAELAIKAVRHPALARRRLGELLRRKLISANQALTNGSAQVHQNLDLSWVVHEASNLVSEGANITFHSSGGSGALQIASSPLRVETDCQLALHLSGTVSSSPVLAEVSLGGSIIATTQLPTGEINVILDAQSSGTGEVVINLLNIGENEGVVDLNITLQTTPNADAAGGSEMDHQGWTLGYAASGIVVAIGNNVTRFKSGDRVACAGAGLANHAEYIAVPENLAHLIPNACSQRDAASATIGAIALQGVRRAHPQIGETVAVVGLGLLGQITSQILKGAGVKVIGLDLNEERAKKAAEISHTKTTNIPADFERDVRELTGGQGADATIITAASKSDNIIDMAMRTTRRKGRVVIVGDITMKISRADFYRKEIDLLMSTSYGPGRYDRSYEQHGHDYPFAYVRWTMNRNMGAFMELIADGTINMGALIDTEIAFDQMPDRLKDILESPTPPLGIILEYPTGNHDEAASRKDRAITLRGHQSPRQGKVHFILAGVGAFSESMIVPALDATNNFQMVGVVSNDAVRGGNFARRRATSVLSTDLKDAIAATDSDLVVIANRHSHHAQMVITGLQNGQHVYVEKPLAINWQQYEEIERCIQENIDGNGQSLTVGFNRRHAPATDILKTQINARTGPAMINYRINGGYIDPEHWVQTDEGGGRNIGEACHFYDFCRHLVGAPVTDVGATSISPAGTTYLRNDNFIATLQYADGSIANITYTALGPKSGISKEFIEVFVNGECYVLDDFRSLYQSSNEKTLWSAGQTDKGHRQQFEKLSAMLTSNAPPPLPLEEALEATMVSLTVEDLIFGRRS